MNRPTTQFTLGSLVCLVVASGVVYGLVRHTEATDRFRVIGAAVLGALLAATLWFHGTPLGRFLTIVCKVIFCGAIAAVVLGASACIAIVLFAQLGAVLTLTGLAGGVLAGVLHFVRSRSARADSENATKRR
jgi:hypothetical protein